MNRSTFNTARAHVASGVLQGLEFGLVRVRARVRFLCQSC